MTFPCVNTIQLVPTMQKKLFTLSFQLKFLKIWFTKLLQSYCLDGEIFMKVPRLMFLERQLTVLGFRFSLPRQQCSAIIKPRK